MTPVTDPDTQNVLEAMRQRNALPSPEDAALKALRAVIWQRSFERCAALDAVACAKAGMAPHPLMSLGLRQLMQSEIARLRQHKADLEAREQGVAGL